MADNNNPVGLTRQQLYDRIRETSKEEVVLEGMIRLGFWPSDQQQPNLPADIIRREGELHRELSELLAKERLHNDRERALKEMRKQRLLESRKKQEETKKRREEERLARAKAWKDKKEKEILYLGQGVSAGLQQLQSQSELLSRHALPAFDDAAALAAAMQLSVNELRFLAFSRKVSKINHYKRFHLPKKSGGQRLISAPMPRLKKAQHWILQNILAKVPLHQAAHGFVPRRSILSNASQHLACQVVINIDLKDFFPSVSYPRVKGLFVKLGYAEQMATLLALICTEADIQEVQLDGEKYYLQLDKRFLPQGAPSSPAITNLLCRRLDQRLQGLARSLGFTYTRYADDMTFSAPVTKNISRMLWGLQQIIESEGFVVHPGKIRVMRKNSRQEVTGIIVNQKASTDRQTLKKFRALLFQIEKDGPEGKHWGNSQGKDLLAVIWGYANYVKMIDPEKGGPLVEQVRAIRKQHNHRMRPLPKAAASTATTRQAEQVQPPAPESTPPPPQKPWWKIW